MNIFRVQFYLKTLNITLLLFKSEILDMYSNKSKLIVKTYNNDLQCTSHNYFMYFFILEREGILDYSTVMPAKKKNSLVSF